MKLFLRMMLFLIVTGFSINYSKATDPIIIKPTTGDMTPIVRKILEGVNTSDIKLHFEKGTYRFLPDYAQGMYLEITNHGNGYKKVIFNFDRFRTVEIEGNGAEFIFHGLSMPFFFKNSTKINISNLTIDWDIPFTFLGEVVGINKEAGYRDIKPFTDGFSWRLRNEMLEFPNIDGFNYDYLGSTLAFDPKEKRPVHGAWDIESKPSKVEKLSDGTLRFHEHLDHYPPVGSLLSSKGDREHDRYAPAFEFISSSNITLTGIVVHHALGMAFLFERSQDIKMSNCGVYLRPGTQRVISSTADATHFCNCKGSILIENCRFENMLDDGTNVHGTYVEVDEVLDANSVRVKLGHFEQLGFEIAEPNDEFWFIRQPSPERNETGVVNEVIEVNDQYTILRFTDAIPKELKKGDILENKTWNPEFTMTGTSIKNHRARNVVLKTPLKTVIQNNTFSSMMSSIFLRGESFFWYESGAVNDVLIKNNIFEYCAYSGAEHAVLTISPRLGKSFDNTITFDRNIRFENNIIRTFDNRIVMADRVDGLIIYGNTIYKTNQGRPLYPEAPLFELENCQNVRIEKNVIEGDFSKGIEADEASSKSLSVKKNKGLD